MHKAFISYSSEDQQKAMSFCALLERNEIPCWIAPRNIPVGSDYTKAIPEAIDSSPFFIVLVSKNAQASRFVLKELEFAVSIRKQLIPVMLEDCPLTNEFRFLIGVEHRLNAYQMNEQAIEQACVQRILNPGAEAGWNGSVEVGRNEVAAANTQAAAAVLTIKRKIQLAGSFSAIRVSVDDGTEYKLMAGNVISLSLPVGEHRICAVCYKLKTVVRIHLTKDTKLCVGFNPWTGRIDIEALSQTDMTLIESR